MDLPAWRDAARELLGLVLPVACVGCGADDHALCSRCRDRVAATPRCVRLVAGVRLDAAHEYEGIVRTVVLELKLRGRLDLAGVLGRPVGKLVRAALADAPPGTVVLRVPPSRSGAARRGFDPVVVLLRRGGVRGTSALRRVRACDSRETSPTVGSAGSGRQLATSRERAGAGTGRAASQKSRTGLERVAATVGTLRADGVRGRTVVLVDDVVTTGVTMAEAIRAVREAGGTVTRCVAAASVDGLH